jgi:serine phosphatase RsbU (regulator of sigma subunit)
MFSDGVTEARAANDDEFGEDRLVEHLNSLRGRCADEVVREVYHAVERFMGDEPAADDITVVAARRVM